MPFQKCKLLYTRSCITWQVIQLSLLQIGHLKELILSVMKHQPWQSGVLQWNEFLAVTWASFKDFCWCFSYSFGDTSWKKILIVRNLGYTTSHTLQYSKTFLKILPLWFLYLIVSCHSYNCHLYKDKQLVGHHNVQ